MSPVLFSLFLNDLKVCLFFTSNNVQSLKLPFVLAQDECLQDIERIFVLFLLLYVGDTIGLNSFINESIPAYNTIFP